MSFRFIVITLFPQVFPGPLGISILKQAMEKKIWSLETINLRDFGLGKSKRVDDRTYGGGAGMILSPVVVSRAIEYIKKEITDDFSIFVTSPIGEIFNHGFAKSIIEQKKTNVILCGRYEGIDKRVIDYYKMREISIGQFVLAGGELAAMTVIEACVRLLPDVLKEEALAEESFSNDFCAEYDQFTRPSIWNNLSVPEVLLLGNHLKIKKWREISKEKNFNLFLKFNKKNNE